MRRLVEMAAVFRVTAGKLPEGNFPPFAKEGPIWKAAKPNASFFSSSKDR
jgi:hypothetical protein